MFKLFDKKMYFPMTNHQTLFFFKELGRPKVKLYEDSVRMIAGFNCKKAVISFPGSRMRSINAYYTLEIGRERPNANTPFEKIPGVLMEFNFFYNTLNFKVVAQKFKPVHIADSEFMVPDGYKETSQEEIESFISTLLQ
jgi:GLPGLI family protein